VLDAVNRALYVGVMKMEVEKPEDLKERERIHYNWVLESTKRLRFFFCGLVFAILSFSIQFSSSSGIRTLVAFELASWIMLVYVGYLSLRECGGFQSKYNEDSFVGLTPKERLKMWRWFIGAIALLAMVKGINAYLSI